MSNLIPNVSGIPLGLNARGTLWISSAGEWTRFVFAVRRGNGSFGSKAGTRYQDCYTFVTASNPDTPDQQVQRAKMSAGVLAWQNLSAAAKQTWRDLASELRYCSGYHLFLSEYLLTH